MGDRDAPTAVTVRLLRASRGWTQGELARRARVDPAALSRYEAGEVRPSRETLRRLAAVAEIPLDEAQRFAAGALAARSLGPFEEASLRSFPTLDLLRGVERIGTAAINEIVALRGMAPGEEQRAFS